MYSYDDILVLPEDLRAFAWSAPMRAIWLQVGISRRTEEAFGSSRSTCATAGLLEQGKGRQAGPEMSACAPASQSQRAKILDRVWVESGQ